MAEETKKKVAKATSKTTTKKTTTAKKPAAKKAATKTSTKKTTTAKKVTPKEEKVGDAITISQTSLNHAQLLFFLSQQTRSLHFHSIFQKHLI